MTVLITLTIAGTDTGPFNLYSDVDGFVSAFETGVSKANLLAGYVSVLVPNGTNVIRIRSNSIYCTNYIDINIVLTTTTTTTVADPAFATLTFTSYEGGEFTFDLDVPIPSTSIVIDGAQVSGSIADDCVASDYTDNISIFNILTIFAGAVTGTQTGMTPITCSASSVYKLDSVSIVGLGTFANGNTVMVGGTLVTISISTACIFPYVCSLYTAWEAQYGSSPFSACAAPFVTVYTTFSASFTTGTTVYTDTLLSLPLVGYTYITAAYASVHEINSGTGVIGTDTFVSC